MTRCLSVLAVVAGLSAPGCGTTAPYLWNGAPTVYQRRQIERFDPYPYNDIGPEMTGVRPPGFDQPAPEPVRARWKEQLNRWYLGY